MKFTESEPVAKVPSSAQTGNLIRVQEDHVHLTFPGASGRRPDHLLRSYGGAEATLYVTEKPKEAVVPVEASCELAALGVEGYTITIDIGMAKVAYRHCGHEIAALDRPTAIKIQNFLRDQGWDVGGRIA
jgi:hypothetical protein